GVLVAVRTRPPAVDEGGRTRPRPAGSSAGRDDGAGDRPSPHLAGGRGRGDAGGRRVGGELAAGGGRVHRGGPADHPFPPDGGRRGWGRRGPSGTRRPTRWTCNADWTASTASSVSDTHTGSSSSRGRWCTPDWRTRGGRTTRRPRPSSGGWSGYSTTWPGTWCGGRWTRRGS